MMFRSSRARGESSLFPREGFDYDRPDTHRYRWTGGLKAPNSWLVRSGEGCWDFSDADDGTRIDWSSEFELTSPLAYPFALVVRVSYMSWMKHGLEAMRSELAR